MTFQQLVSHPQNWINVDIHLNNGLLEINDNHANRTSDEGWTYIYELHHDNDIKVVYIGNTKETNIMKRVQPELNHKDVLNELQILLRDPTRQLQNTNMRLTRQFHNLCQDGAATLRLYYLDRFNAQVDFLFNNEDPLLSSLSFRIDDQVIGENLQLKDVITWLPKVIQGIRKENYNAIVPLEKCLLLKHAVVNLELPKCNLGFR